MAECRRVLREPLDNFEEDLRFGGNSQNIARRHSGSGR